MRVGLVSLMHESNTFTATGTPFADFERDRLLVDEAVREHMAGTHHEIGGFFDGLTAEGIEAVPVFAAWAMPSGPIDAAASNLLAMKLGSAIHRVGPLDG